MLNLSFFIIFLVHLAASLVIRKDGNASLVCELEECHNAAEHILKWMNTDFKPCEDFFEYACGYWHTPDGTVLTKKQNDSLGARGHVADFYLKNILAEDPAGDESPLYGVLRKALSLCMDEDTFNAQGVAPAVKVLEAAGGWPLLEDGWTGKGWDFLEADMLLGGQFMHLETTFSWNPNASSYLKVKGPFGNELDDFAEGLENEKVQKVYKQLVNVSVAYGAERERAERALKRSVKFEIAMAKAITKHDDLIYDYKSYSVKELREEVKWVNWTRFFQNALPDDNVPSEDDTIKANPRLLNLVHKVALGYPKVIVANYLMSYAAANMAAFLPESVRALVTDEEEEESPKDRYDTCVTYLSQKSSLSIAVASYLSKMTADNTAAAWELVNELKQEWARMIEEMNWLDEASKNDALESVSNIKLNIGFVPEILDIKKVENYYKNFKIPTSNYFELRLYDDVWETKQDMKRPSSLGKSGDWTQEYVMCLYPVAGFNPLDPTIIISAEFLHFIPLFSSNLPLYVKYGQLGYIIGHEMTHALDIQANPLDSDEEPWESTLRFAANQTEEVYNEKKSCFINQYSSFNDTKFTGEPLNGNHTQREDIADNGGLKLALRTYRRLAAQLTAPEPRLPQLEHYSPEQLFFISAANAMCHIPDEDRRMRELKWDVHTLRDFRIRGMAMNSPDFSNLFSCQKGEPMNPPKKCEVW